MARLDLAASFYGGPGFTLYHAWGENSATSYRPHFHDEYLVGSQLRGYEDFQVSGKMERFAAGDLVLINPQQVHTGNVYANRDLEYISVYIDRERVEKIAAELEAATHNPEFTVIKGQDDGRFAQAMLRLLELTRRCRESNQHGVNRNRVPSSERHESEEATVHGPDSGHSGHLAAARDELRIDQECALNELIVRSLEQFSNMRHPMVRSTNRIGHRKIARAVEFMREQASGDEYREIDLDALAETAELSKFHFLRQFSQTVGMTPGAYLRTIRLSRAAKKLRQRELPILDIALSVGFSDHPSFSRAFARYMGMTPSEYQRLGAA